MKARCTNPSCGHEAESIGYEVGGSVAVGVLGLVVSLLGAKKVAKELHHPAVHGAVMVAGTLGGQQLGRWLDAHSLPECPRCRSALQLLEPVAVALGGDPLAAFRGPIR